jgi:hypothetical protein
MAQFRKDTNQFLPQEKTLFETVMIADQYGNVTGANPSGMAVDAFGRARTVQPVTLFDSQHRYKDNGKVGTANSATDSSFTHDANSSSVLLNVTTANGAYVYRESNKVFDYQPGKSLQILQTFCLAPAQAGLRQRYGYFNTDNGFFLEQDGANIYFVKRSKSSGTIVETRVAQADWNVDTLDGTNTGAWTEGPPVQNRNPSGMKLDLSKAQIMFHDIEWLGVGSVRSGFVINGRFIHCHTWNHANIIDNTYMTTACLPVRCEIQNTANTSNTSSLRIICATVISEGGFEPKGTPRAVGMPVTAPKDIPTAGTFVPIISIRLKDAFRDSIVVPRSIQFFGVTNNTSYRWKIVNGCTLTNPVWVSAGDDSPVEYDISATGLTGGRDLRVEYLNVSSGAGAASQQIDPSDIYKYQLERLPFAIKCWCSILSGSYRCS